MTSSGLDFQDSSDHKKRSISCDVPPAAHRDDRGLAPLAESMQSQCRRCRSRRVSPTSASGDLMPDGGPQSADDGGVGASELCPRAAAPHPAGAGCRTATRRVGADSTAMAQTPVTPLRQSADDELQMKLHLRSNAAKNPSLVSLV